MAAPLLQVRDLRVSFPSATGEVRALDGVSFDLARGKVLGVVGESGCGKSTLACAIAGLVDAPGKIPGGEALLDGEDVLRCPARTLRRLHGGKIGMVFQDAAAYLNPVFTVGNQICETLRIHARMNRSQAWQRAGELLALVGVDTPERRLRQYPHELSGGMRQRVMIALALCGRPELLIADEPTSSLDVTVQAQILQLLRDLRAQLDMAVVLVTHDLGVAAEMCDEILVLYAGRVCEHGGVEDVFYNPCHEYTKGLLRCAPTLEGGRGRRQAIPGGPPSPAAPLPGCPYAPRCPRAMRVCLAERPKEFRIRPGHVAACWQNALPEQKDGEGL